MSRFLGTINTRLGLDPNSPFKFAKVYETPGCYSYTIPRSATSAKVYVVGAGSSYCAGRYCATSSACWSGVHFPVCDYSFDFCGHLTGSGGGYAEKTYNNGVSGAALNITVAGSALTTCAYHTSASNTVYVRGEVANSIAVGSTATSPYSNSSVSNVSFVYAATTGNTTVSSTSLVVASNSNVFIGSSVTGPGILFNTYVTNISGTTITLSAAATITSSNSNYVFSAGRVTLADNANTTSFGSMTISGVSTSSVSGGLATVSASSGTNLPLSYTCQGNSTARNGSLDNDISLGFKLPVCGYTQCYNGWYNIAGTGSGGDVNRSGGAGLLIPEFVGSASSCFDQSSGSAGGAGTPWLNPVITCACNSSYIPTFGGTYCEPNTVWCAPCHCYYLCAGITNAAGSSRSFYRVISSSATLQNETSLGFSSSTVSNESTIQDKPYGIGASAGSSAAPGEKGFQPGTLYESNLSICGPGNSGSAGPSSCIYSWTCQIVSAYDYSFGTNWCFNQCACYHPGCTGGVCGLTTATNACYVPLGYLQCNSPNFGSGRSWGCYSYYICSPPLHYSSGSATCFNKCMTLSYDTQEVRSRKNGSNVLRLSNLKDPNGNNINDIEYATGAYALPAKAGGGGNRLNPAGGPGLVVILHN